MTLNKLMPNDFLKGFFSGIALVVVLLILAAVVF
jgi:hypothetical protein